jgi:sugar lactone lactonase YvrE
VTHADLGVLAETGHPRNEIVVAESYRSKLTAFDIDADGGLSNQQVWADLDGGIPDGIYIDGEGAVW